MTKPSKSALHRHFGRAFCKCFGVVALLIVFVAFAAAPPKLNDPTEGQKLAAELRNVSPTEEVTFKGVLRIYAPKSEPRDVPIQSKVLVQPGGWSSVYTATLAGGGTETLTVRHAAGKRNEYELSRNGVVQKLDGDQATNSFAGSDFSLLDLGMEFFHWPTQFLATREMRKGQGCDVLESHPGKTNSYSRVLSWIDQESRAQGKPGLLMAEAYDSHGKPLKEFEINDFTKVAGQWQVSGMELRNRQTKTRTRLQFDFDKD